MQPVRIFCFKIPIPELHCNDFDDFSDPWDIFYRRILQKGQKTLIFHENMTFLTYSTSTTTWSLLTSLVCNPISASSFPRCAGRKKQSVDVRPANGRNVQWIFAIFGLPDMEHPTKVEGVTLPESRAWRAF